MAEETWHAARLIPTSGLGGAEEQERRATSALLAVMSSVKEFGRGITIPLGAPAGSLETYTEAPFDFEDRRVSPDGLIRARRGTTTWTALVEVKTKADRVEREQLECYLDVAREQGFDAVITISNEIAPVPGAHPTAVDKRKLKKVALHHLSWTQVLAEAVMQKEHRGVADPDQAWILGELIRYLEDPRSGTMSSQDEIEPTENVEATSPAASHPDPVREASSGPADHGPASPWWTATSAGDPADETAGADGVASWTQLAGRIGADDGHAGIEALGLGYPNMTARCSARSHEREPEKRALIRP